MDDEVSQLLAAAEGGDAASAAKLLPLVYAELRQLAAARMAAERPGQTLDATALVHEAYVRLAGGADRPRWQTRGHFFAAAAEAMRRILVDRARRKRAAKHGGDRAREPFDADRLVAPIPHDDLLALDEALTALEAARPGHAQVVKLRFFAGLTTADAAAALGISVATAERRWAYARAALRLAVRGPGRAPAEISETD